MSSVERKVQINCQREDGMGRAGRKIKLFADGADLREIKRFDDEGVIDGFTSNPDLMNRQGVTNYEEFIRKATELFPELSMSFEVLSDDLPTMEEEARKISTWSDNIFVKVPIINTKGESTGPIIKRLSDDGVQLNITVVFTLDQVRAAVDALSPDTSSYISVFSGRIADTGIDPIPLCKEAVSIVKVAGLLKTEVLWASTRQVYNILQAEEAGCSIITVGYDVLDRLPVIGRPLVDCSLDMVKMFYDATKSSGLTV